MDISVICKTTPLLIKKYSKILTKFSKNEPCESLVMRPEAFYMLLTMEIESLDILPEVEKQLKKVNNKVKGLFFSTNSMGEHNIEIYDDNYRNN